MRKKFALTFTTNYFDIVNYIYGFIFIVIETQNLLLNGPLQCVYGISSNLLYAANKGVVIL